MTEACLHMNTTAADGLTWVCDDCEAPVPGPVDGSDAYPDNDDDGAERFVADESDWTAYPDNDDDGLERESTQ